MCKDAFRGHVVSVLNSGGVGEPRESRTWSVSVRTSELVGTQMEGWCSESVLEAKEVGVVRPLLFTDVQSVRIQTLHKT